MIPSDLVAEAAAVSLVLFVGLVLCVPLVLAMVGTVEGQEARPLEAAVTWMRRHRAQHRRSGRRLRAQWDIQLAHAGGRYEELPSVAEYDTDTLRLFHDLNAGDSPGLESAGLGNPHEARPGDLLEHHEEWVSGRFTHKDEDGPAELDWLTDTDFFPAIQWEIGVRVHELGNLQKKLWAGYRLPPWKGWKR